MSLKTKPRISAKIKYNNYHILDYHSLDHIPITYLRKNGIWKKQQHMARKQNALIKPLKAMFPDIVLGPPLDCYPKDRFLL